MRHDHSALAETKRKNVKLELLYETQMISNCCTNRDVYAHYVCSVCIFSRLKHQYQIDGDQYIVTNCFL